MAEPLHLRWTIIRPSNHLTALHALDHCSNAPGRVTPATPEVTNASEIWRNSDAAALLTLRRAGIQPVHGMRRGRRLVPV